METDTGRKVGSVSGAENSNSSQTTDVLLGYGVRVEGDVQAVTLHGGVVGRPILTSNRFEIFDSVATATLGASVTVAGVRPGLLARVPLDDSIYATSDATIGVTLDVPIRR